MLRSHRPLIQVKADRPLPWRSAQCFHCRHFSGRTMTNYRIYCINGTHVSAANLIDCETDAAARDRAAALLDRCGHIAAEVWERDRFVCRINRSERASTGCCCAAGGGAPAAEPVAATPSNTSLPFGPPSIQIWSSSCGMTFRGFRTIQRFFLHSFDTRSTRSGAVLRYSGR